MSLSEHGRVTFHAASGRIVFADTSQEALAPFGVAVGDTCTDAYGGFATVLGVAPRFEGDKEIVLWTRDDSNGHIGYYHLADKGEFWRLAV